MNVNQLKQLVLDTWEVNSIDEILYMLKDRNRFVQLYEGKLDRKLPLLHLYVLHPEVSTVSNAHRLLEELFMKTIEQRNPTVYWRSHYWYVGEPEHSIWHAFKDGLPRQLALRISNYLRTSVEYSAQCPEFYRYDALLQWVVGTAFYHLKLRPHWVYEYKDILTAAGWKVYNIVRNPDYYTIYTMDDRFKYILKVFCNPTRMRTYHYRIDRSKFENFIQWVKEAYLKGCMISVYDDSAASKDPFGFMTSEVLLDGSDILVPSSKSNVIRDITNSLVNIPLKTIRFGKFLTTRDIQALEKFGLI